MAVGIETEKRIVRARAPLRLGLGGGGSDVSPYCDQYGGVVLNATISLSAYCVIERLDEPKVQFIATDRGESFESPIADRFDYDGNLDLHKGVYNRIVKDFNGGEPLPVKVTTYSDAPAGSGLGSSSTMVVSILTAFSEFLHLPLGEYEIAHMAFEIEREDIGLSGGAQDQYAATFGGVNLMEFYADNRVIVNPLRVKHWIMQELQLSTVLYYTGRSRDSATIIDQQIENYQKKENKSVDAVHELKAGAVSMKEALLKGNIRDFADILGRSWQAKRQLAAKISNAEIETVIDASIEAGAYSGKVSGAGGGGFLMLVVDPADRMRLVQRLGEFSGRVVPFHFVNEGAHAWWI